MYNNRMRYLGVDYGKKRVGIALSDERGEFALPKAVLPNDRELIKKIKEICDENGVKQVVIGESKNYKGEENAIMENIRSFADDLKGVTRLPVVFEPEFLTSAAAERIQGKNEMHDASAAALILKSYLERNK
jgi:putative Holliday junction resolvase